MATVSDSFDRSDSTSLGSNWAEDSGDWAIVSNYVRCETTGSSYRKLRWTGTALASNDVAVEAVVQCDDGGMGAGVFARGATDATVTYYGLVLFPTYGVYLVEITGGSESILGSYTASPPAINTDVTLRLECEGSTLRGYVNGTLRITQTDATLTSGSVGIMSYAGGSTQYNLMRADSWQAYDLTPAAPTEPAYIGSTTNGSSTTGTSLALSLPSGAQAGDLLVAALVHENANPAGLSGPSGWSQMSSSTPSGTARALRLTTWYRVMESGDTGPWSWTTTTAYERGGIMAAYRYADVPTVWASSTTNSSSVNAVAPTITTGADNAMVLVAACSAYGTTWTAPTDYTERADYRTGTGTNNVSISLHERLRATAGATGTATAVAANADYWVAAHVELPFAPPGDDLSATGITSSATVGAPAIAQVHALSATGVLSGATAGAPDVGQAHVLGAAGLLSTGTVGAPTAGEIAGAVNLTATGIAASATVGAPTIAQTHSVAAAGLLSGATCGTPTIGQTHVLGATGTATGATVGVPVVAQSHALNAAGVVAVAAVGRPAVGQAHALTAAGVSSAPTVGAPSLASVAGLDNLGATGIASSPSVGSPTLAQSHALNAAGVLSGATVGAPSLVPIVALGAEGVTVAPAVGAPALTQAHALGAAGLLGAPAVGVPVVGQAHALTALAIVVAAALGAPGVTTVNTSMPTPLERLIVVVAEARAVTVGADARAVSVEAEARTVRVAVEDRRVDIAAETRLIEA